MERNAILAKTAKGQAEVRSRTHALPRMLRSALIMVDGNATAGEILTRCGGTPDAEMALDSLVSQGFVEIKGASAAASTAAAPTAPSAGTTQPLPSPAVPNAPPLGSTQPIRIPVAPAQSREEAMAALRAFLAENLGHAADALAGALERAGTRDELHAAAEHCAYALAAAHGASTAQAFRERVRAYLEAYFGG